MIGDRSGRRVAVRPRSGAPAFAAVVLLVAACGGGGGSTGAPADPTTGTLPTQPAPSETPTDGLEDQAFAVDQHFWHSGFRVDVVEGEIASTTDELSKRVTSFLTLSATFENLGADTGFFGPSLAITTSDNSYPADQFADGVPNVPGGLKSKGTLVFLIDQEFDLASAELLVGDANENQARIPLTSSGDAVRLEPRELPIAGTLSMELVDLTFTSAALRFDVPEGHRQVEKGKLSLTLNFDALSRKDGSWNIFATNLALILPDGNAVAPDDIVIGSLDGSDAGILTAGRSARFMIDEMAAGDYTLRLSPGAWFVGADGVTEATFEFSIE